MFKIQGADRKEYGPVPSETVRQWIVERRLDGRSLIQAAGEDRWRPLGEFPEFAAALRGPSSPPLPPRLAPSGAPLSPGSPATLASGAKTSGWAVATLVCGLMAFCTWVTWMLGIAFGVVALSRIKRSQGRLKGRGLAIAGMVLSVVGLLVVPALLLPALAKHKMNRRGGGMGDTTSECVAHAEQLSRAIRMYANDNNDVYPPAATWCEAIQGEVSDAAAFQCPARPGQRSGFSYNLSVAGRKNGEVDPTTVLLFESDQGWNGAGKAESATSSARHRGQIVVVLADGSVRLMAPAQVGELRWEP